MMRPNSEGEVDILRTEVNRLYQAVASLSQQDAEIKRLREVLAKQIGASAKVKALEWYDAPTYCLWPRVTANTTLGDYTAGENSDGGAYFTAPPDNEEQDVSTIDAAKAAAQADFDRRILSCLVSDGASLTKKVENEINSSTNSRHLGDPQRQANCGDHERQDR
jgi:hypothetical protein